MAHLRDEVCLPWNYQSCRIGAVNGGNGFHLVDEESDLEYIP
jgi:hypothetical protein